MADTCDMFNSIDKVIEWPILGHKPDIVSFTSFTMRANSPAELVRSTLRLRVRQCICIDMSFYECIMEGGSPENFAIAFLWVLRVHLYHLLAILSRNAVTSTFIYQAIGAGIPMFSSLLFLEMFWVSKFKCKDRVVTAASFKCVCKCAWRSVALCDGELDHHFSTDEGMDHTILMDLKNGPCNLVQSGLSVLE